MGDRNVSVTQIFFQHLKYLYLDEFPVVNNGIHIEKYERKKLDIKNHDKEELLDLLKDKKSPWYELIEWSTNGDSIKETYLREPTKINRNEIQNNFTCLKFKDQNISFVDPDVKCFIKLEELILTCNQIQKCDAENLPSSLKVLDLSGNYLQGLFMLNNKSVRKLQHLGLSMNWIQHFDIQTEYWLSLVSLDLSSNHFENVSDLIKPLQNLKKLKVLSLNANPIVLLPGYRGIFVDSLPNLIAFDDKPITKEERINFQDFKSHYDLLISESSVIVTFHQIRNLILPEIPDFDDEPEVSVYKYLIKLGSIQDDTNDEKEKQSLHSLAYKNKVWNKMKNYRAKTEMTVQMDPSPNIDFNEKGILKLNFKSLRELRDHFLDGTDVEIIERKINYRLKDYEPPSANSKKTKSTKGDKKSEDPKKKKKKNPNFLDNYNVLNEEDKQVAKFGLDLHSLLDGSVREIKKKYSIKQDVPLPQIIEANSKKKDKEDKNKMDIKKSKNDPKDKNSKKKIDAESLEPEEPLPLELDLTYEVFTLNSFTELKSHLKK